MPARINHPALIAIFGLLAANTLLAGCASAPPRASAPQSLAQRVVQVARSMIGHPYRYGGDTPRGFDCSGLVYYSFEHAGERVPRTTAAQRRAAMWVSVKHIRKGDLIFFKERGRSSSHVGIYIGHGKFVHAPSTGERVRTDRLSNPYWRQHFVSVRRFPFM